MTCIQKGHRLLLHDGNAFQIQPFIPMNITERLLNLRKQHAETKCLLYTATCRNKMFITRMLMDLFVTAYLHFVFKSTSTSLADYFVNQLNAPLKLLQNMLAQAI